MEPHYMFRGTLGFRGTPVEEHWSRVKKYGHLNSLSEKQLTCIAVISKFI